MKQKVLITGSSRGLGLSLTKKYLEEGCLVFAGVRDVNSIEIMKLKEQYQDTLIPVEMDVVSTQSVEQAFEVVSQYTDQLDIIINNAAIHSVTSSHVLEKTDIDDCMNLYNVNSVGPLRVSKAFLPLIKKTENGMLVNISSESGSISAAKRDREFAYCMSKAALNMGTKLLHNYLKDQPVKVLAVHPGWLRTDMGGSNADYDPYDIACQLVELFEELKDDNDGPIFVDHKGKVYPW